MSATTTNLRPEIAATLADLRDRIRKYVLVEGISLVVAVLGGLFWLSLLADIAWFRISRLELPLWFRWGFTLLATALFVGGLLVWVLFRLLRSYESKALALVLERRFPELDDRLVTAVELSGTDRAAPAGLGGAMLEQTVVDAVQAVRGLNLSSTFDSRPLRRALLTASVLAASILVFGVANAAAMRRWFDAYIAGEAHYWDPYRQSQLTVQVIAQPGDRVREFSANRVYKHPRGANLTLVVTAQDGKAVPETVTIRYRAFASTGTNRGAVSMSRAGDRQFRQSIDNVIAPHELWVVGGDFTNREPFLIEIVDPPQVDRIEFDCDYPAYTGRPDETRVVQGAREAVPMETRCGLRSIANKPLRGVELRTDHFLLSARLPPPVVAAESETDADQPAAAPGIAQGTLTILEEGTSGGRSFSLRPDDVATLFSDDRRTFRLPLHVSQKSPERLTELLQSSAETLPLPTTLPLAEESQLQIYLEDEDEILAFEPAVVTLVGTPDAPPVIDVRPIGIGNKITRLATIPLEGTIIDDYGIADAGFVCQLPETDQPVRAPFENPPRGLTNFQLKRSDTERVERFDVLPLQLDEGKQFQLLVEATDADDLNGPHVARSTPITFEIVSEQVLLASLYEKEMDLRQRFEHIREEVDIIRNDLLIHRGRQTEGEQLRSAAPADLPAAELAEQLRQIEIAVEAAGNRGLHLVRKNHAENRDVENRFIDILAELVNNRADTEASVRRLSIDIIAPLNVLNQEQFPRLDEQVGLLVLTIERGQDPRPQIDEAVVSLDRMLALMDAILENMQQRRGFNDIIQELQAIVDRQKEVLEQTEAERKRTVIDDLFNE
jgi:hypothetical protein